MVIAARPRDAASRAAWTARSVSLMLSRMTESTRDLLFGTARRLQGEFVAAEAGSMRPSALAERLHIAARSATEVVDALEERGLVERAPDPDDRRATLVRATGAAQSQVAEVDRVREEQTQRFLAGLNDRDRTSLYRILKLLADQPMPEGLPGHHGHGHHHGHR